jgi:hypothetical protein
VRWIACTGGASGTLGVRSLSHGAVAPVLVFLFYIVFLLIVRRFTWDLGRYPSMASVRWSLSQDPENIVR